MRLDVLCLVSCLALASHPTSQEAVEAAPPRAVDDAAAIRPGDGDRASDMKLAFVDAAVPLARLELTAAGACRHFVFLVVSDRPDTVPVVATAVMMRPIFVLPLAVFQGQGPERYAIADYDALPPGIAAFLQGLAFRLDGCGGAPLTVTEVHRLLRIPADVTGG